MLIEHIIDLSKECFKTIKAPNKDRGKTSNRMEKAVLLLICPAADITAF